MRIGELVRSRGHGDVYKKQAYLVGVEEYELMQRRLELLEGLSRGERAVIEGRTFSHSEARGRMPRRR